MVLQQQAYFEQCAVERGRFNVKKGSKTLYGR